LVEAIDAVAKESLVYGWPPARSADDQSAARNSIFVVDYAKNRAAAESSGFVPYIGPKVLDGPWLPGRNF